jgi:F-type H+-transporting ATPase subunit gamma
VAGGQERVLRQRIKSVQATRKITKAMELIAASQIARAQARITANRPYREAMQRVIVEAALGDTVVAGKLLATPEKISTVAILVIVGDRGLAGAYNGAVLRATERLVNELQAKGVKAEIYAVGKKAGGYLRFRGFTVTENFVGIADKPTFDDARTVAQVLGEAFASDAVQQVLLVSTHYLSAASQTVTQRQLLPLALPEGATSSATGYTEFEPDAEALLRSLAARALESDVFTALLEGSASFHTSQQRAMAAATENADELATNLKRVMNRARQDAITTEIMEIVGGAEALRSGK